MTTNPPKFTIADDGDLGALWRRLMGPGGFGRRSLWMIFLDVRSQTLPLIFPIDDLPDHPDELLTTNLSTVLEHVLGGTEAVAISFLLSRPGGDMVTDFDRAWARALMQAVPPPTRRGPIHLGTRNRVRVLAPDDLLGAAS